ncbi:MAG: hypothetical protein ASARMPREDX12_002659 [Alectoria sarmentosa]|nr:MAG: hypothetical protein ASARMPREDX12_002659 [Alectoria sarmentosa]
MPAKSRFTRLDAFTKTVEDARVRTTSGGVVTIASLLIVFYLVWGEWSDYRRVTVHPELIVDKGRGERMEIHLNVSFPRIPCELLTLDVMDVSGEQQTGVKDGLSKVQLAPVSDGGLPISVSSLNLHGEESASHLDPDYCGNCYGAIAPPTAIKSGCCNTCEEVREAYASVSWAFGRGENVEQCEREHYSEKLDAQRGQGCRIEGGFRVNKVIGNFHIAPGRSFSNGAMHVHDLNNYLDTPDGNPHTFTHQIHHLRFGPQVPESVTQRLGARNAMPWTNHHLNPLDQTEQVTDDPAFNYMYFVKVVSTSYLPLGWQGKNGAFGGQNEALLNDLLPVGSHGRGEDGSLETHQYSVTSHKRSLSGGSDSQEGHKERLHASYDISPMKVINREERTKTFAGFLTGVCAVIGGTLTVAAAIDRGLSNFPGTSGYLDGRFCAPVPSAHGTVDCCLPCPITDWVYSDDFNTIPKAANWLNVAGIVCSMSLLLSFIVLPVQKTNRHYLTIGLVVAICFLQLGFIVPLAAKPEQCHDTITPNDMYSDMTCAFSGAFLLFGGFAAILWGFLRSLSIHLQICWQVVTGKKFFWCSLIAGWGLPGLFLAITLPLTGTSYRFGDTCHINHTKALQDYCGPLLAFAAISTILQFATFGYCIRVYVKSLFNDGSANSITQVSSELPTHSSHSGSVKTVTAGQAYRRVKKVIGLQWRGTAIVLITIINVVFLSIVFVQMDNTVIAALQDLEKAEPWLLCLVINGGDKAPCLDKVKQAGLVANEGAVMAALVLLSLNGIWTLLFLGRTSMLAGWTDVVRRPLTKRNDFVSVDARGFSNSPKNYEMISSPPPTFEMPKTLDHVVTSPRSEHEEGLSPLPQSPPSPSSHYTNDYFKEADSKSQRMSFSPPQEAEYKSPKLSFSTPRPPSAATSYAPPSTQIPFHDRPDTYKL